MITPKFNINDEVFPMSGSRGTVIEVRPLEGGDVLYCIEDSIGCVNYYTERALRLA